MATIAAQSISGFGVRTVTKATLTASDTFTFIRGNGQILVIDNDSGGALTILLDGAGGTTVPLAGVSDGVDVTGGYSTGSIANGASVAIPLDSIFQYLQGVIAVTGGTGAEATLYQY